MDYLVFGVGFGSTLVLLGWVLRQFGPSLRYRDTPEEVLGAEQLLERNDWQRFCIAMGALLSVCGAVMLLVTLITLLIRPADRTGTIIVGSIFVISLLAVAAWIVMYVNQHRALAGDRRAEAVAATRGRTPARSQSASVNPATAASAASATSEPSASEEAVATAASEEQRRRKTEPLRPPTATAVPKAVLGATSIAAERPATRSPRPTLEPGEADAQDSPSTSTAEPVANPATTTMPTAEPSPALRNLQFKRVSSSRREDHATSNATMPRDADAARPEPQAGPARPDPNEGASDGSSEVSGTSS